MTCFITGDTHGSLEIERLDRDTFPQGPKLSKDDYVIIAGDFGLVLDGSREEQRERSRLAQKNWTTLFVDGNHENFSMLDEFPQDTWHGGQVHRISRSILHLMRGQVFDICGKKVFVMGGACSIDAPWRTEGLTWWPEELPNESEFAEAEHVLDQHGWKVDAVITHDCSARILRRLYGEDALVDDLNEWLDMLEDKLNFDVWYFGHHHNDIDIDDKHIMLYRRILEIME